MAAAPAAAALPPERSARPARRALVAARFGLQDDDLATLGHWIEGASVRWGLDQRHRDGLGLGPAG
ncbi:exodeoxyribonuclease V subunit gamma [Massilia sp. H-1]|nr:exodeoxyribonuclease V subunit gamma [Massilia sp. H-1]